MATEITMPQLSDTMDEGTILTWLKKEGDQVSRGDALAEVATDKADLEIESFHEGVLLKIHSPEGTKVKVGSVIAVVGKEGEEVGALPEESSKGPQQQEAAPQPTAPQQTAPAPQQPPQPQQAQPSTNGSSAGERQKISPLAKNLAEVYGVDYSGIRGTGEGGRIVKRDIEQALGKELSVDDVDAALQGGKVEPAPAAAQPATQTRAPAAPQPQPAHVPVTPGVQPLSRMRATIASRMVQSMTEIPHFYVTARLEMDNMVRMRETLKSLPQYEGVTYNHLMVKAAALALKAYPRINAAYRDEGLLQPSEINIGIVTALEDGLLIPVVRNADTASLSDIVSDSRALVQRARAGRPKADDLTGGTFSISNMGPAPVEDFTAVINPGQGAILAVAGLQDEVLVKRGAVVPGKVMRVTLSVDHRIIDGVVAGQFVTELKRLVEDPVLLLA